jgi:septum formation protein
MSDVSARERERRRRRGSLVLASASPRRREILAALGIDFEVVVPEIEEAREGRPDEVVLENALRKARAVFREAGEGRLVLGVDTDVVLDGRLLGKAGDEEGARDRLVSLSGRTHEVLSGVAVIGDGGRERTSLARSEVTFRRLDRQTVELYLRSGEWRDRAGAYAIQRLGSILVERLEGDFSNVVGLPVGTLLALAPEILVEP